MFAAPFRTLVALSVLIALTSTTFSDQPTGTETALSVVLLVASIYIQIAIILAAGRADAETAADPWLRGAFRRRCFWRFLGTSVIVVLGLLTGAVLVVVGMFFVGALFALAQSASVLERRIPMDAIVRSAQLGKGSRWPLGTVFGLFVLVPTIATQGVVLLGWIDELGYLWPPALAVADLLTAAGTIALTRMFVALGGDPSPAPDQLAPPRPVPR